MTRMDNRRTVLAVTGLTMLAVALRLIALNGGLWYDEIVTLVEFARLPISRVLTTFPDSNNHPLYSLLAAVSTHWLGESVWTLRLPAVVFGVATIPLLYALGRSVSSEREGLLAAALLTVSYHHVWFSQDARAYSALAFWTILMTWLFWRGLRSGRRSFFAWYGVAAGLSLYTHLTMASVIAAHGAAWMLEWRAPRSERAPRRDISGPLLAFGLAFTIAAVCYAPLVAGIKHFLEERPTDAVSVATSRWAAGEALRGLRLGFTSVGLVVAAVLVAGGLWSYATTNRFVSVVATLPVLGLAAFPLLFGWPLRPRFFFFEIGLASLVTVRGAIVAGRWLEQQRSAGGRAAPGGETTGTVIVVMMILLSASSLPQAYRYPKQDFEGAMRFVEGRAAADAIATVGVATLPYQRYFAKPWMALSTAEGLERFRARTGPVWIVYTLPAYLDSGLRDALSRDCRTEAVFQGTVGDGDVVVCRMASIGQ